MKKNHNLTPKINIFRVPFHKVPHGLFYILNAEIKYPKEAVYVHKDSLSFCVNVKGCYFAQGSTQVKYPYPSDVGICSLV